MDFTFSSRLQTHMQKLGRSNGFAPPESQDPADEVLHEYYVAETGRAIFEKRKKLALEKVYEHVRPESLSNALKQAKKGLPGTTELISTENYTLSLTTKTPATRLDPTVLRMELVKFGVMKDVIERAFKNATTSNEPAKTFTATLKST